MYKKNLIDEKMYKSKIAPGTQKNYINVSRKSKNYILKNVLYTRATNFYLIEFKVSSLKKKRAIENPLYICSRNRIDRSSIVYNRIGKIALGDSFKWKEISRAYVERCKKKDFLYRLKLIYAYVMLLSYLVHFSVITRMT